MARANKAQFCYECSEYFYRQDDWEAHCATHLAELSMFCGQIIRRGVILFARHCPFCLTDTTLPAAKRYQSFTRTHSFFKHLELHVCRQSSWPMKCPHPICESTLQESSDFWAHAKGSHGIARYKQPPTGVNCSKGAAVEPSVQLDEGDGISVWSEGDNGSDTIESALPIDWELSQPIGPSSVTVHSTAVLDSPVLHSDDCFIEPSLLERGPWLSCPPRSPDWVSDPTIASPDSVLYDAMDLAPDLSAALKPQCMPLVETPTASVPSVQSFHDEDLDNVEASFRFGCFADFPPSPFTTDPVAPPTKSLIETQDDLILIQESTTFGSHACPVPDCGKA